MHTHYKGTGKVHSFRGQLASGEQEQISIEGSVGAIAWRIVKFQTISVAPGVAASEQITKIFREEQASITSTVNFSSDELLGVSYWSHSAGSQRGFLSIIFDNSIFVRNIFVTTLDAPEAVSSNYYIELEEVTVSASGKAQLALAAARRTGER